MRLEYAKPHTTVSTSPPWLPRPAPLLRMGYYTLGGWFLVDDLRFARRDFPELPWRGSSPVIRCVRACWYYRNGIEPSAPAVHVFELGAPNSGISGVPEGDAARRLGLNKRMLLLEGQRPKDVIPTPSHLVRGYGYAVHAPPEVVAMIGLRHRLLLSLPPPPPPPSPAPSPSSPALLALGPGLVQSLSIAHRALCDLLLPHGAEVSDDGGRTWSGLPGVAPYG